MPSLHAVEPSSVVLSVVIPVYNEVATLDPLYTRLSRVLDDIGLSWEILLVNDGSTDGSWTRMQQLRTADPRVSLLNLSRNFGHQLAITAGMDHATGEAIVVMDADLQDPPEAVAGMVEQWQAGFDVVYGIRESRAGETLFKRLTAALFYRTMAWSTALSIPLDVGDFRLMSRRVVEALRALPERHRFVRGLVTWVGFRQTGIRFQRDPRHAGSTKYPLAKMLHFALDGLLAFTVTPLRLATALGLFLATASVCYAGYAVTVKLAFGHTIPGWASLMVAILLVGGAQLFCLGVIGEYVGRIYSEVKKRPLYLVQELHQGEALEQSDTSRLTTYRGTVPRRVEEAP